MRRIIVVNLDDQPARWQHMLTQVPDAVRWPATAPQATANGDSAVRRLAILHTYQQLLEALWGDQADEWVILQDDVTITDTLEHDSPYPIHLYGGWRRHPHTDLHICPKAFKLRRTGIKPLLDIFQHNTRICTTWTSYLNDVTCSYRRAIDE